MIVRLLLAGALVTVPTAAFADCSVSAVNLAFGTYDGYAASALDMNGSVTVACTANSGSGSVEVALNVGSTGGGASYSERDMAKGGEYLGFNLYKDSARTIVWGDGTGGSQTVTSSTSLASTGGTVTFPVYGRVRVGQRRYASAGQYASALTATITY